MARDRVSVDMEDNELHDEPFITSADHIKSRQDKSHMPAPRDDTPSDRSQRNRRNQHRSADTESQSQRSQTSTSSPSTDQAQRSGQQARSTADQDTTPDGLTEDEVVQRLVKRLRKKGASQEFIDENMDRIREKARQELL